MNLDVLAPGWIVIALLALLTAAAIEDAARLRISNLISIAVLLLAFVAIAIAGPQAALWQNLLVFAILLTVGTFLFGLGKLGGGDVKLLAATALWFPLAGALRFVLAVMIAGGVLALIVLALRWFSWSDGAQQRFVILRRKAGIPYGVAIAAGAALAILFAQDPGERRPASPLSNWDLARPAQ